MKKPLLQKQIPTLVGLAVLLIGMVGGVVFFTFSDQPMVFAPRATPQTTPKKVRVTNVTDSGFTVSFLTDEATAGYVKYGQSPDSIKSQVGDDRDQLSGSVGNYSLHHITVRGLEPGSTYYYFLGTGRSAVFDNEGVPFSVKTAARGGTPSAARTAYGTVADASGKPADGAVVYLSIQGVGDLSSLVKSSGSWAIALSNARTPDGAYANVSDDLPATVTVQGVSATQIATQAISLANSQPVPAIALGGAGSESTAQVASSDLVPMPAQSESKTVTTGPLPDQDDTALATQPARIAPNPDQGPTGITGELVDPFVTTASNEMVDELNTLLTEKQDVATSTQVMSTSSAEKSSADKESMTTASTSKDLAAEKTINVTTTVLETATELVVVSQPKITGRAKPNTLVIIEVNSDTQLIQEVTADELGNFGIDLAELAKTLEPGPHTVTVTYIDEADGQAKTKTIEFTVPEPTSSTPTAAPTSFPNLLAMASPSTQPYGTSNPYTSSNSAKTATTSTKTTMPATGSALPKSGSTTTTLILLGGGLFFLVAAGWSFWIAQMLTTETD